MKTTVKTLFIIIFIFIVGCKEDVVNNNGTLPPDYHLYYNKINSPLRRFESYTINMDGSSRTLFIDTLAVTSCSYNGKLTLAKLDTVTGFYYTGLYTADNNGTNIKKIPSAGYYPYNFIISNTGDKVLFTTDAGNYLCIINSDGTGFIQISDGIRGTEEAPKFSPDGKMVAYFEAPPSLSTGLYINNVSGTNKKLLKDNIYYDIGNCTIDWSPDGSKIVYQNKLNNGGTTKICIIDTSGNGYRELTIGSRPKWSSGSDKIIYDVNINQGIPDIFVINPDGTGLTNITNSPDEHNWAGLLTKDGNKFLYSAHPNSGSVTKLMYYDFATGTPHFIIDSVSSAVWKY